MRRVRVRFEVDEDVPERREAFEQVVLDEVADPVALGDGQVGVDLDVDVGEISLDAPPFLWLSCSCSLSVSYDHFTATFMVGRSGWA